MGITTEKLLFAVIVLCIHLQWNGSISHTFLKGKNLETLNRHLRNTYSEKFKRNDNNIYVDFPHDKTESPIQLTNGLRSSVKEKVSSLRSTTEKTIHTLREDTFSSTVFKNTNQIERDNKIYVDFPTEVTEAPVQLTEDLRSSRKKEISTSTEKNYIDIPYPLERENKETVTQRKSLSNSTKENGLKIIIDFPIKERVANRFSTSTSFPLSSDTNHATDSSKNIFNPTTQFVDETTSHYANTSNIYLLLDLITKEGMKPTAGNSDEVSRNVPLKTNAETVAIVASSLKSNSAGIPSSEKFIISSTPASDSNPHSSSEIPDLTTLLTANEFNIKSMSPGTPRVFTGQSNAVATSSKGAHPTRASSTPEFIMEYFTFSKGPLDPNGDPPMFLDDYEVYKQHGWIDYDCCL